MKICPVYFMSSIILTLIVLHLAKPEPKIIIRKKNKKS